MTTKKRSMAIHFRGEPSTDAEKGAWHIRRVFNYRPDADPNELVTARDAVLKIIQEIGRHHYLAIKDSCKERSHSRKESLYKIGCFAGGLIDLIEDHPNMPTIHLDDPEDWDGFGGSDDE